MNQGKANKALPTECARHGKHPLPTTQEKTLLMGITRWSILKSAWLYSLQPQMGKLYTVSKTRPGVDCGSDHELLIAKFRLQLKKVGKTTRPFMYDLNQIPCDYTVKVTNNFKWLDLIDRVRPEELWMGVHDIVQEKAEDVVKKKKRKKKTCSMKSFQDLVCPVYCKLAMGHHLPFRSPKGSVKHWALFIISIVPGGLSF